MIQECTIYGTPILSIDFLIGELVRWYKAVNSYDVNNEPLDGDAVEDLTDYIKAKINVMEGNV